jgi:hypothetical protein
MTRVVRCLKVSDNPGTEIPPAVRNGRKNFFDFFDVAVKILPDLAVSRDMKVT